MSDAVNAFILRWSPSSGNEMSNFQAFAIELAQLLDLEAPKPATSDGQNNDYRFERPVDLSHTGKERRGRIDLYRKGCFVLEAKQGGERAKPQDKNQLSRLTDQDAPKAQAGHAVKPPHVAGWIDPPHLQVGSPSQKKRMVCMDDVRSEAFNLLTNSLRNNGKRPIRALRVGQHWNPQHVRFPADFALQTCRDNQGRMPAQFQLLSEVQDALCDTAKSWRECIGEHQDSHKGHPKLV